MVTLPMVEAAIEAWNKAEDTAGGRGPILGTSYHATVKEMIEAAVKASGLNDAINNSGSHPVYHREIMARHRKEWPTLWRAIERLYYGNLR